MVTGTDRQPENLMPLQTSWTHWARQLEGLTPTAKLVCIELSLLADSRGVALVPLDHLIQATARSRRSVENALRLLEGRRQIQIGDHLENPFRSQRIQLLAPKNDMTTPSRENRQAPPELSATPSAAVELTSGSPDPLARRIGAAIESEWTGPNAWQLAATLEQEGPQRFGALIRDRRQHGITDPWDTLTLGWEVLQRYGAEIASAERPWGLWVHLTARATRKIDLPHTREIPTSDTALLDWATQLAFGVTEGNLSDANAPENVFGIDDFDERLRSFVGELVQGGMPEATAWAGTARLLELVNVGDSRRHWLAARDSKLQALGVGEVAARTWMSLLVGSRRGQPGILSHEGTEDTGNPGSPLDDHWRSRAKTLVAALQGGI